MSAQGSGSLAPVSTDAQTHQLLIEWGRWVRAGRPDLDANSMFKLGSTVPTPMICDDVALIVDGIVARLKLRREDMGRVIMLYYARGWQSDTKVGKHLRPRRSETYTRSLRQASVAWIDGVIEEKMTL